MDAITDDSAVVVPDKFVVLESIASTSAGGECDAMEAGDVVRDAPDSNSQNKAPRSPHHVTNGVHDCDDVNIEYFRTKLVNDVNTSCTDDSVNSCGIAEEVNENELANSCSVGGSEDVELNNECSRAEDEEIQEDRVDTPEPKETVFLETSNNSTSEPKPGGIPVDTEISNSESLPAEVTEDRDVVEVGSFNHYSVEENTSQFNADHSNDYSTHNSHDVLESDKVDEYTYDGYSNDTRDDIRHSVQDDSSPKKITEHSNSANTSIHSNSEDIYIHERHTNHEPCAAPDVAADLATSPMSKYDEDTQSESIRRDPETNSLGVLMSSPAHKYIEAESDTHSEYLTTESANVHGLNNSSTSKDDDSDSDTSYENAAREPDIATVRGLITEQVIKDNEADLDNHCECIAAETRTALGLVPLASKTYDESDSDTNSEIPPRQPDITVVSELSSPAIKDGGADSDTHSECIIRGLGTERGLVASPASKYDDSDSDTNSEIPPREPDITTGSGLITSSAFKDYEADSDTHSECITTESRTTHGLIPLPTNKDDDSDSDNDVSSKKPDVTCVGGSVTSQVVRDDGADSDTHSECIIRGLGSERVLVASPASKCDDSDSDTNKEHTRVPEVSPVAALIASPVNKDNEVDSDTQSQHVTRKIELTRHIPSNELPINSSPEHRTEQFRLEEDSPAADSHDFSNIGGYPKREINNENAMEIDDLEVSSPKKEIFLTTVKQDAGLMMEEKQEPDQAPPASYSAGEKMDEDDVDPDALTIDTGGWSVANSPDRNVRNTNFENSASTSRAISDDDIDPDALTIDTAPFDSQKKVKNSPPGKRLLLNIKKTFKKAVNKQGRKLKGSKVSNLKRKKGALCPNCPNSTFTSLLAFLNHQKTCGVAQNTETQKAPRKVYMCSTCGSYYENWDLFLHMKEMHKRHICLYCLGMFSQASKLVDHLSIKHNVVEHTLKHKDHVQHFYPGAPLFLLCASCNVMCTENNYDSHVCASEICSHCGLTGTHYPTCRLAPIQPITLKKRAKANTKGQKKQRLAASATLPPPTPPVPDSQQSPPLESNPLEFSPTTYNEKMMQLYKGSTRLPERPYSTPESIEESINRVLESVSSPKHDLPEMKKEESLPPPSRAAIPSTSPLLPPLPPPPPPLAHDSPSKEEMRHPVLTPSPRRQLSESDSSDSDKLTIELNPRRRRKIEKPPDPSEEDGIVVAGEETPFTCVPLPEPLDRARVPIAMKLFLRATALTCVYCAHARKIAVNAKLLALHQLAQHRYVTIAESSTQSEKSMCHAAIVPVMRDVIPSLETIYFNAYGFDSSDKSAWRSADRVYECFHCSFITPDLREFSQHNRKLHWNDMRQKRRAETHLCIMCKTRFLTYSELLCHLCRGAYVPGQIIDPNSRYRCYCCDIEPLPSSFRLMVHLRSTHTACDMCFTVCDSQAALHAHVMKHKTLYYCYACALTYETRQELSKHIFWKHGAESATCKRCLQKKWKHAYHFCLPPPGFACDVCGGWFKTTLALKVHSRLHTGELPHACTLCTEKCISKKLLAKHMLVHTEPVPEPVANGGSPHPTTTLDDSRKKPKKEKKKDLRDLFDLPPVNLSESDDSSSDERANKAEIKEPIVMREEGEVVDVGHTEGTNSPDAGPGPPVAWGGVLASLQGTATVSEYPPHSPFYKLSAQRVIAIALADHDYCRSVACKDELKIGDHDYCNNSGSSRNKHSSPRKSGKRRTRSSSSDSSSSSSSSCSCGSNCSCTSSTSSTESATSGEPRPRDSQRKKKLLTKAERRKAKDTKREVEPEASVDVCEIRIQESDLETDESVTDDEQFYELNPALRASEVLQLNRSILLDKLDFTPSANPVTPMEHSGISKPKKRKGRPMGSSAKPKKSRKYSTPVYTPGYTMDDSEYTPDADGRRPRRKRVPLKFYGFSSGEEDEYASTPVRRKEKIVEHNTTIPAPVQQPEEQGAPSDVNNLWNPPSWRPPPVAPRVHPIKIRTGSLKQTFAKSNNSDEFHIKRAELGGFHVNGNDTSTEKKEKLYCFCQCPYDEVSEMIACDAVDCAIEWFHFECVGIMDPPKGKWFCPDCKKKAAAESEMLGIPFR